MLISIKIQILTSQILSFNTLFIQPLMQILILIFSSLNEHLFLFMVEAPSEKTRSTGTDVAETLRMALAILASAGYDSSFSFHHCKILAFALARGVCK